LQVLGIIIDISKITQLLVSRSLSQLFTITRDKWDRISLIQQIDNRFDDMQRESRFGGDEGVEDRSFPSQGFTVVHRLEVKGRLKYPEKSEKGSERSEE
jgi:hypothetical protein